MLKVEDMMTRNPHTLFKTNSIADAKSLMEALDIRHIPVIEMGGHLLGLVSQRDVLAAQDSSLEKDTAEQAHNLDTPLELAMRSNIMSVSPKAGLKESAIYMRRHKVGCLPVVEDKMLVGIITDSDFVAIAIHLLELQEEVEPEEQDFMDDDFDDVDMDNF